MTNPPAVFGDTRIQFGDTRVDWAGNWLDGGVIPPVDGWILRNPQVLYSPQWSPPCGREQREENRLARFMRPRVRELNVYRLVDGSYTDRQPRRAIDISHVWFGGHINIVGIVDRDGLRDAGFTVDDA